MSDIATGGLRQTASPDHKVTVVPSAKRIRAVIGGEVVADTARPLLVLETGHAPVYYFPPGDVRGEVLRRSERRTRCPYKGEASYRTVALPGRTIEDAAWCYEAPLTEVAAIAGYFAFYWDKVEHWWEEDEEVFGHPRDPFHRVDVRPSSRRVEVLLGGETIADTRRGMFLFETGLRTRHYIPREDVRMDRLVRSPTRSTCPYKGFAAYFSAEIGGRRFDDIAWSYETPLPESVRIKDMLCFYAEKADAIRVEGQPERR
jgi:uncharacterized protein (DUF427 family)